MMEPPPPPSVLVVWEHLIAHPAKVSRLRRTPLHRWVTDSRMTQRLHEAWEMTAYAIDIVTFLGKGFSVQVEERLNAEHVPFRDVKFWDGELHELGLLNTGYEMIVHGCEDYEGWLGDGEVYLRTPYAFDLPVVG